MAQGAVGWARTRGYELPVDVLLYRSLVDLVLETGLGFGSVVLVMELVTAELAQSNLELAAARDRLEVQARVDPLTDALNRHAFHTLFGDRPAAPTAGCAVLIDIDNLKQLNDTQGHAAGDQAIRDAAKVIRHAIRADDLLFRWGGDEFLAILFGMSEGDAHARFRGLLERIVEDPTAPRISWGIAQFQDQPSIGTAIEAADRAMYAGRERRRAQAS